MHILQRLHSTIDRSARLPGVRKVVESSYLKAFVQNRDRNLFHGVFDSFEAAASHAASYGDSGCNNEASASLHLDNMRVDAHDYPAMLWLERSFQEGMRSVFDVGGSIGVKYFAFAKALPLLDDVIWTVQDVPAVVVMGKTMALELGVAHNLRFTDHMLAGDGAQVLLASGSLQSLPRLLSVELADWSMRPRRIIVNNTPIHATREFFTVNSIGTAFRAYRIQTQSSLVQQFMSLGYTMKDN